MNKIIYKNSILLASLILISLPLAAKDLGFRYSNGKCLDGKKEGLNPSYIGQCGDLRHITINGYAFDGMDLSGARFDGADVQGSTFSTANLTGVSFAGANLSGVGLDGATVHSVNFNHATLINTHFGKADLQDVDFTSADMTGALLSYMKFPNAKFAGVNLSGAVFDHADLTAADLTGANLQMANFANTKLDGAHIDRANLNEADFTDASLAKVTGDSPTLRHTVMTRTSLPAAHIKADMRGARLEYADLTKAVFDGSDLRSANLQNAKTDSATFKGAKINKRTVLPFSASDAAKLGMLMSTGGSVYIIWDKKADNPDLLDLKKYLEAQGVEVMLSPHSTINMDGTEDLSNSSSILHLLGDYGSNEKDYAPAAQKALVKFVNDGGVYIGTEWLSYMESINFLKDMKDLLLLDGTNANVSDNSTLTPNGKMTSHPVLDGISKPVAVKGEFTEGKLREFSTNPSQVLMTHPTGAPALMTRDLGAGHVLDFSFAPTYTADGLKQDGFRQIILNAINWD